MLPKHKLKGLASSAEKVAERCFPVEEAVVLIEEEMWGPEHTCMSRLGLLLVGWGRTHPTVGSRKLESVSLRVC